MYVSFRRLTTSVAALIAAVSLGACGSSNTRSVAVRIGSITISKATVAHWMTGMAAGRSIADPSERQALRRQALDVLISSQWLIGEVQDEGLGISEVEARKALERKRSSAFPGGEEEFREFLKATGQSRADIMLEAKTELASAKLLRALRDREPKVTDAQILAYYEKNRLRYAVPERRELEITNRKSAAEVEQLRREVAKKVNLADVTRLTWFARPYTLHPHEGEVRPTAERSLPLKDSIERAPLEQAIFTAKKNVLTGPVRFRVDYFLFELKRITAAKQTPLAQVKESIRKQLQADQQRRTLAAFVKTWRAKWRARTSCFPGYVVQKCREHTTPASPPEDPYSLT